MNPNPGGRSVKKTIAVSMVIAAALTMAVLAPSSSAREPLKSCGTIPIGSVYNVTASPGIGCHKARKIIKKAISGKHQVLGFQCHSGREGQYGFAIKCHRGDKRVIGSSGV